MNPQYKVWRSIQFVKKTQVRFWRQTFPRLLYHFYTIYTLTSNIHEYLSFCVIRFFFFKGGFVCVSCAALSRAETTIRNKTQKQACRILKSAFCAAEVQVKKKKSVFALAEVVKLWERRPTLRSKPIAREQRATGAPCWWNMGTATSKLYLKVWQEGTTTVTTTI